MRVSAWRRNPSDTQHTTWQNSLHTHTHTKKTSNCSCSPRTQRAIPERFSAVGMKGEIKRVRWRGKIKIYTSQGGRALVSAHIQWHECESVGGSHRQLLSGVERRRSAFLLQPESERSHSYSLLVSVQASSSSPSLSPSKPEPQVSLSTVPFPYHLKMSLFHKSGL